MGIRITVNEGHRVRDEHGNVVAAPIERPSRTPYWVRRELDGEVTIAEQASAPHPSDEVKE
jgi:hypothetical protein